MNKLIENNICDRDFSRILPTAKQYIQGISKNLKKQNARKALQGCISDKKNLFENIRVLNLNRQN